MTDIRLVAFAPNGARLGPIPAPEDASVSYPLNDLGAVSLKYPPVGPRTDLMGQPLEIVVEASYDQGLTWAEPPASRFLYLRDGRDPIRDDSYAVECPAYLTRLEKGLVDASSLDGEGKRSFLDATPGAILDTLMDEAQARGALTGLSWAFTGAVDSAGTPWPAESQQSVSYDPGTSILAILLGMAESFLVDFRTNGRALEVFVSESINGLGADRTLGATPVTLRPGRDITEAPFRRTWEALADTALVQGDAGAFITRTNGSALTPWGRQETFITASGVTDTGTMTALADAQLQLTAEERSEFTVGLDFSRAAHLPLRDYSPGEWVYRAVDGSGVERVRVRQVTLTLDNQGRSGGNAVLNDRFLERDILTNRRIKSVTGGATPATPGTPSPVGNDILAPAKPLGLDHTTAAYIDRRIPQAQVTLSWLAVTTNADGTPISDLNHYEVWRRNVLAGPTAWDQVATVQADRTSWSDSPYEPGTQWEFRTRAVDAQFNWSAFSDPEPVTMAVDIADPDTPSAPVLGTRNGILEAAWDGLDSGGGAMPDDVERVEVHRHQDPAHVPTPGDASTLVASFRGPGVVIVSSLLTGGDEWTVWLIAVDYAGNASAPSAPDTITVDPLQVGEEPDAPATSPAVTLTPLGVGSLVAKWPAVAGADDYALYVDDAPITAADPAKLHGLSGGGTQTAIARLPDTTALVAGTTYYARVLARNETGDAVGGLGAEGTGTIRQAEGPDIAPSYVYTGGVQAGQIQTGDLDAILAIIGQLTMGNPGAARVEGGPFGLRQYDATGQLLANLPTDGTPNQLRSELVTDALTALGRAQFQGHDNEISRDSIFTLASGVTDPANRPSVVDYIPRAYQADGVTEVVVPEWGAIGGAVTLSPSADIPQLTWDAARSRFVWIKSKTLADVARQYLCAWVPATGAYSETLIQGTANPRIPAAQLPADSYDPDALFPPESRPVDERFPIMGTAAIGDILYCLIPRELTDKASYDRGDFFYVNHGHYYVYQVNLTNHTMNGSVCWRWTDTQAPVYVDGGGMFGSGQFSGNNLPNLHRSQDGNLYISQVNPSTGLPVFKKKTPATGATTATITGNVAAPNPTDRVASAVHATLDVGERLAIRMGISTTVHHLDPATGATYGSGEQWEASTGGAYQGCSIGWNGTRFYSSGAYGNGVSVHATSLDTTAIHWAYTWYDPDVGGTGIHETSISPVTSFTPRRRWGVQALPPFGATPPVVSGDPDSPSAWRMYAATGAAPPGPASMYLQARTATPDTYGYYYVYLTGTGRPVTGTGTAPTDNSFPDGYAGIIQSGTGGYVQRGDGTGAWPYLQDAMEAYADLKAAQAEANAKASVFAPGDIIESAATTRAGGFLLCNGTFINQTAYSALFAAIGHTFNGGVDPGDGTFRLPDRRDRQGVGASGTKPVGSTGGAASAVLTGANLPAHTHSDGTLAAAAAGSGHVHLMDWSDTAASSSQSFRRGSSTPGGTTGALFNPTAAGGSGEHSHDVTGATGNGPGTSSPVATQDPYVALNYFIKT